MTKSDGWKENGLLVYIRDIGFIVEMDVERRLQRYHVNTLSCMPDQTGWRRTKLQS